MTRRVGRRTVLAASVPLVLAGCFRRDDGTQPGMGETAVADEPEATADGSGGSNVDQRFEESTAAADDRLAEESTS